MSVDLPAWSPAVRKTVRPRVAITTGEPAGIGPEIAIRAAWAMRHRVNAVLVGDAAFLAMTAAEIDPEIRISAVSTMAARNAGLPHFGPERLCALDIPLGAHVQPGVLDKENGRYVLATLDAAIEGVQAGWFDAVATAPVQKSTINDAGVAFTGHTEYFAEQTGTPRVVMMLAGQPHSPWPDTAAPAAANATAPAVASNAAAPIGASAAAPAAPAAANATASATSATSATSTATPSALASSAAAPTAAWPTASAAGTAAPTASAHGAPNAAPQQLRVALATTHLPLKDVSAALTLDSLTQTLNILDTDLRRKFGLTAPRILVAGLNPHAGENGYLGREEIDTITPALAAARERGIDVRGPYPADTLFQPKYLQDADCVLAMYHDQGLPVLKYATFGHGVNITLGLPLIRTSVDHGTALDLAAQGLGRADCSSMQAALEAALQMVQASRP